MVEFVEFIKCEVFLGNVFILSSLGDQWGDKVFAARERSVS